MAEKGSYQRPHIHFCPEMTGSARSIILIPRRSFAGSYVKLFVTKLRHLVEKINVVSSQFIARRNDHPMPL